MHTPRRLIWIPIVHTATDLGSFEGKVKLLHHRRGGESAWQDRVKQVGLLWRSIRRQLFQLDLDFTRLLVYQDGLPVCGQEARIVEDLARAGSANHRLLLELRAKGATLLGTESPDLLIEEYQLNRQLLLDQPLNEPGFAAEIKSMSRDILDRRDAFIARRIEETLEPDQTGCLFLGLMHSMEGRLPSDIVVDRLQVSDEI